MLLLTYILIIELICLFQANSNNSQSLFLINFGSNSDQCINRTTLDFCFTTEHDRVYKSQTKNGNYDFVNSIPVFYSTWHNNALDHTENDAGGYMLLVDQGKNEMEIFNLTIDYLCTGFQYEFSAYMANIIRKLANQRGPYIRFQVRSAINRSQILADHSTGEILAYDTMNWTKFSVSFRSIHNAVVLLMLVDIEHRGGNDVAIDDVELRVINANGHSGYCPFCEFKR